MKSKSKKKAPKKRTASDFLAMLSEVVITDDIDKEEEQNDQIQIIEQTHDPSKDLPDIQFHGSPILFNDWFNVVEKNFHLDKPELKLYKSPFGLALSTKNSIPNGPVELFPALQTIPENVEMTTNDPLAPSLFDYRDFQFIGEENSHFRKLSALHIIDHICRDFEAKSNRKTADTKDSNFTFTTVLVICPHKLQAYEFISELIKCLPDKMMVKKEQDGESSTVEYEEKQFQIENYERLQEYTIESISDYYLRTHPQDWLETFGGNSDSDFKTGIRFFFNESKVSLFQEISKSQVVIASPLALSLFNEKNFMSSIEVLVLDSIDVLMMQHPDRFAQVLYGLNTLPKTVDQTDWSHLRKYCADNNHKKMRQSIGYGRVLTPEIYNLYSKHFENIRGQLIIRPLNYPRVLLPLAQTDIQRVFKKMNIVSGVSTNSRVELIGETVYKTFVEKVVPMIKQWRNEEESVAKRTIIYFVSTFRFFPARKLLDDDLVNYLELSDESTPRDQKNMKRAFKEDPNAVLLLTERHYFYFRPKLNAGRVIFLQPPSYPLFAQELAGTCSSTIYFTEYDEFALERIVGTDFLQTVLSNELYSY